MNDIITGDQALHSLNHLLEMEKDSKCFILTDTGSRAHCLDLFYDYVPESRRGILTEIAEGDEHKTIDSLMKLWDCFLANSCDSSSYLINLGGGMVCDLGGFAAATYNRGIPYFNVPTTLLSMVDASIGGKTGINLHHYKNKAGVFALPEGVFISPAFLASLPEKQILSGLAEAFKNLIVGDAQAWLWLEKEFFPDPENIRILIHKASDVKRYIVQEDFYDTGIRKSLNFGHTLGHAIETLFLQKNIAVTHGEAVAAGMVMELFLSKQLSGLDLDSFVRLCSFLHRYFSALPIEESDVETLLEISRADKKNALGSHYLSLLHRPGIPDIGRPCDESLLKESIRFYIDLFEEHSE
jgi:3-dehydroquinate synthase